MEDPAASAMAAQVEIAAYWKSLGITQMLSQGSEGYRAVGPHDPHAPTTYPCARACLLLLQMSGENGSCCSEQMDLSHESSCQCVPSIAAHMPTRI